MSPELAENPTEAMRSAVAADGPSPHIMICGSLYLAGEVLGLSPETLPT